MEKTAKVLALAALLAAVLAAWATPRPLGDLYLALSAGRDILEGKLGTPDDWSFTTGGRVWVNPSWLSGVLLVLVERAGGEAGLLVLKAVLLLGLGVLVVGAVRAGGVTRTGALLAAALALGSSPQDFMLRPNLVSLLFVPVLLWWCYRPPRLETWGWGVLALFGLWANIHGGFIFGLLILALWVGAWTASGAPVRPGGTRPWVVPATLLGSVLIAGFATPFGWTNVMHQLTAPRSEAWNQVTEWRPLFGSRLAGVAFPWLFLITSGLILVAGGIRLVSFRKAVSRRGPGSAAAVDAGDRARERQRVLFECLLVAACLVLAVTARRLVPWAAIAMAPVLGRSLDFVLQTHRRRLPLTAAGLLVVIALVVPQRWIPGHYDPENPLFPRESVFRRMVLLGTHFPGGAARFLAENEVAARAFHEWRWEGYLRWVAPALSLYIGGRAQQVYDEATYFQRREILGAPDPSARLHALGASVIVVPLTFEYGPLCQRLLVGEDATWAYVYADRYTAVLADGAHPDTRELVPRAAGGSLWYPDSASALLSQGLCLASPSVTSTPGAPVSALARALVLRPTGYVYPILVKHAVAAGASREEVLDFLEQERARLAAFGEHHAEANAVLEARLYLAREIQRLYPPEADVERKRLIAEIEEVRKGIGRIEARYPAFFKPEPLPAVQPSRAAGGAGP